MAIPFSTVQALEKPVLLADQGSFFAGGSVKQEAGSFDYQAPANTQGQTIHGDHAYVFYQKPAKAHKYPLVFLHGAGQSAKTWETTPDGRDGFQNIFLSRGYSTYLVDQPRRGRAGNATIDGKIPALAWDQLWFSNFRLGNWPNFFPGVQVPKDKKSLEQFFRQITPNTAAFDEQIISDAMAAVFDKAGKGVLITHSQGGGPGWWTAIKSQNVKAVVAFEPGSGFVFPEGEVPPALETSSPFGALKGTLIALADFEKLTKIPIIIYYGDYIPLERTEEWNKDNWRVRFIMARQWAEAINRHGGNAMVVHLPEIGINGNTHFLFADLNNKQIADHMEQWLKDNKLN
ncbi:MAG: alpha/beta fold hydrolase [Phascolarctobacterium sp.]